MSFPRFVRPGLLIGLALTSLLALALVACGGDDDSSPAEPTAAEGTKVPGGTTSPSSKPASKNEQWVTGLCTAVTSFDAEVTASAAKLDKIDTTDLRKAKDQVVAFLEDTKKRSEKLESDIKKLGDPDVKDGKKIEGAMSSAAGQVVDLFDSALNRAKKLDTSDSTKLGNQLIAIGSDLERASSDIEEAFARIDRDFETSELTRAAQGVPKCAGLFLGR